jgi:hypothetical protein
MVRRLSRAWWCVGLAAMAGLGAASVGCSDDGFNLPTGQSWSSAHFAYSARAGDSAVCASVVDQLEAHFALVNAYLGLTWPGGVIDYYKYVDAADLATHSDCPPEAVACSSERNVQSPLVLDGHELVHVYVRHLGRPPAMFEEGLAEALTPRGRVFPAPTETWRQVLDTPPLAGGVPPPIAYWGGAWLTSYLLRTFGPASFVALYAALARDADETAVATAFQQVYGAALDDVWDQARQQAPSEQGEPIWECAADPLSLGGAPAELGDRCDGRGGYATFSLTETSALTWHDVTLSSGFNVAGCDPVQQLFVQQLAWTGPIEVGALALPAGTYYLASMAGAGAVGLSAAPNVVAPACADAAPFALPPSSSNLTLAIGDGPGPWFAKLHPTGSATVTLAREWDDPTVPDVTAATVEICADCSTACQPFDSSVAVPVADGQLLRLSGLSAPGGATVARFSYK